MKIQHSNEKALNTQITSFLFPRCFILPPVLSEMGEKMSSYTLRIREKEKNYKTFLCGHSPFGLSAGTSPSPFSPSSGKGFFVLSKIFWKKYIKRRVNISALTIQLCYTLLAINIDPFWFGKAVVLTAKVKNKGKKIKKQKKKKKKIHKKFTSNTIMLRNEI